MDAQTSLILNIVLMNFFPQDMYLQISFTVLTQDVKTLNSKKDNKIQVELQMRYVTLLLNMYK